ncbi:hypothetical protein IMZ48_30645 [Candidatus Bathyarchaeota archaeon]|nr:hypothetical protein [Candidatus Bathyarchaeota archaeon]
MLFGLVNWPEWTLYIPTRGSPNTDAAYQGAGDHQRLLPCEPLELVSGTGPFPSPFPEFSCRVLNCATIPPQLPGKHNGAGYARLLQPQMPPRRHTVALTAITRYTEHLKAWQCLPLAWRACHQPLCRRISKREKVPGPRCD